MAAETEAALRNMLADAMQGDVPIPALYTHFGMLHEEVGTAEFASAYQKIGFPTEKGVQ